MEGLSRHPTISASERHLPEAIYEVYQEDLDITKPEFIEYKSSVSCCLFFRPCVAHSAH